MIKEISRGKLITIIVCGTLAVCSTLYYSVSSMLFYNKTGQLGGIIFSYGTYDSKYSACSGILSKHVPKIDCHSYYDTSKITNCSTIAVHEVFSNSVKKVKVLNDVMYDDSANFGKENGPNTETAYYAVQKKEDVKSPSGGTIRRVSVQTYEDLSDTNKTRYSCGFQNSFVNDYLNKAEVTKLAYFHIHPPHPGYVEQPSPADYVIDTVIRRDSRTPEEKAVRQNKFANYVIEKDHVIQYWLDPKNQEDYNYMLAFMWVSNIYHTKYNTSCTLDGKDITPEQAKSLCRDVNDKLASAIEEKYILRAVELLQSWYSSRKIDSGESSSKAQSDAESFYDKMGLKTYKWTKEDFQRLTIQNGFYPDARPR